MKKAADNQPDNARLAAETAGELARIERTGKRGKRGQLIGSDKAIADALRKIIAAAKAE